MSHEKVLKALDQLIADLGNLRMEAFRIKRLLFEEETEKTPVRPPSQAAMKAFEESSKFLGKIKE